MTARPQLDERDPPPEQEWRETSSPGIRRHVLAQTAAEIARVKEARKKPLDVTGWIVPNVVEADEDELILQDIDDDEDARTAEIRNATTEGEH